MLTRLSRVVLMVRRHELQKVTEFYHVALGLPVVRLTDDWAELKLDDLTLSLQGVTTEAQVSTGYSPLLQLQVHDMDTIIAKCVQLGAHLDGPIQYPAHGKVVAMRAPDGHMIGLYEPTRE